MQTSLGLGLSAALLTVVGCATAPPTNSAGNPFLAHSVSQAPVSSNDQPPAMVASTSVPPSTRNPIGEGKYEGTFKLDIGGEYKTYFDVEQSQGEEVKGVFLINQRITFPGGLPIWNRDVSFSGRMEGGRLTFKVAGTVQFSLTVSDDGTEIRGRVSGSSMYPGELSLRKVR